MKPNRSLLFVSALILAVGLMIAVQKPSRHNQSADAGISPTAASRNRPEESSARTFTEQPASLVNFDKRLAGRAASPLNERQRFALAELRREIEDVQIDFDPLLDSPKNVVSTSRYLTRSRSGLLEGPLSDEEAVAKVRSFVGMHAALFPHGTAALDRGVISRRDTTAATGLQTLVWGQQAAGLPLYRSVFKANLSKTGEIMSIASEFMADAESAATAYAADHPGAIDRPGVSIESAVSLAARSLGRQVDAREVAAAASPNPELRARFFSAPGLTSSWAEKVWLPIDASTLRLAWDVTVESAEEGMFRVLVDADSGEVILRHSMTEADATPQYRVWTGDSPTPMSPGYARESDAISRPPLASRDLVQLDSLNATASPNGWIGSGGTTTTGNNVDAYTDRDGNNAADAGSRPTGTGTDSRTFDFPIDLTQDPSAHVAASVTQLFYRCNWLHDRYYSLGFTETAGNFQTSNFSRGGRQGDAVRAEAQDAASPSAVGGRQSNNSNFSTPGDGLAPRMQMYVYDGPTPITDGCLDSQVVIHEYTHGLSNRLVGGGVLINNVVTQGMGEGWSDFYCLALLSKANDDPHASYPRATYNTYRNPVAGGYLDSSYYWGNRSYPYFCDPAASVSSNQVNPLTFKDIDPALASSHAGIPMNPFFGGSRTANEVHSIGEVWCMMLWEARARLVDRYGLVTGNQTMLQLVTDGMKLCPADPNFVQARNAILQADMNDFGGADLGMLWNAFAKRGLGYTATAPASTTTAGLVEKYDVPPSNDATPAVVTFSPLVNQQGIGGFSATGSQAIGGSINEAGVMTFGIVEYNTGSTPNRYWDGVTWNTDPAAVGTRLPATISGGSWSPAAGASLPPAGTLRNGYYLLTARAVDNGGNLTDASLVLLLTPNAETVKPVVQIIHPAHNSTIAALNSISGTASDSGGSGLTGAVTLNIINSAGEYWSGTAWSVTPASVSANVAADGTWQTTLLPGGSNARTGPFIVSSAAYDWAGNVSQSQSGVTSVNFTVTPAIDTTRPLVRITSPSPTGASFAAVTRITGTASDDGGAGLSRYVTLTINQNGDYWNGSAWTPSQVAVDAVVENGQWVYDRMPSAGNVRAGLYAVSATAHDYAGNDSQAQSGVTNLFYNIDATPPTGGITAPLDGGTFPTFPAFSGTASDSGGIRQVTLYLRRNRDLRYWNGSSWVTDAMLAPLAANYNAGDHTFTGNFTLPAVGVNSLGGSYTYIAIPIDAAGNHSQHDATITIDYHAVFTWTGASNPANNLWDDPDNWDSVLQEKIFTPGEGDIAVIASGAPALFPGESASVYELRFSNITDVFDSITVKHALTLTSGNLGGHVILETGSVSDWSGGYIAGLMEVRSGAVLNLSGSGTKDMDSHAVLSNLGTLNWTGGNVRGTGGFCTINNLAGGRYNLLADGSPLENYNVNNVFNNSGLLVRSGGTGPVSIHAWTFNNSGVIRGASAGLRFDEVLNLNAGTLVEGASQVQLGGTVNVSSPFSVTGSLALASGSLNCPATGVAMNGLLSWTGGQISGRLDIPAGSTLNLTGSAPKQMGLNAVLNNAGTINWTGGYLQGTGGGCVVNNLAGATYNLAADGSPFEIYNANNVFNNAGTLARTAGTAAVSLHGWLFNNSGTIRCDTGLLQVDEGLNLNAGTLFSGAAPIRLNGTVNANASFTIQAPVALIGGSLNCTPGISLSGTLEWSAGLLNGALGIPSGSTLNLTGSAPKQMGLNAVLNNAGSINWTGGYLQGTGGGCVVNNLTGATYNLAADGSPFEIYNANNVLNNAGTLARTAGTAAVSLHGWLFNNSGTIRCDTGLLQVDEGLNLNAGTLFSGAAPIRLNGTVNANASFTIQAPVALIGGSLNCTPGISLSGTLEWSAGLLNGALGILSGSTLNLTGSAPKQMGLNAVLNNAGTINWTGGSGGYLQGTGGGCVVNNLTGATYNLAADGSPFEIYNANNIFNNSGSLIKTAGTGSTHLHGWTFRNSSVIAANPGPLVFDGAEAELNAGGLILGSNEVRFTAGTVTLRGTTVCAGHAILSGATLAGHADGSGTLSGSGWNWVAGPWSGRVTVAASCSVLMTGSAEKTLNANATLDNHGSLSAGGSGLLRGIGGCRFNNHAGAIFDADTMAFANFNGGNLLTNDGTIRVGSPLGVWPVQWDFLQSPGGRMDLELGGTTAGTQHDRASFTGALTLGGTLNLSLRPGYTPNVGDSFDVLTYGTRSGSFASVLTSGFPTVKSYNPGALSITVSSVPTNLAGWKDAYFGAGSPDAADGLDPDHDGIANLMEYATAHNPLNPDQVETRMGPPSAGFFDFDYTRSTSAVSELQFHVEWSNGLSPSGWSGSGVSETILGTNGATQQVRAHVPTGGQSGRFARLRVSGP